MGCSDSVDLSTLFDTGDRPVSYYAALPGAPSASTIHRAIRRGDLAATLDGNTHRVTPQAFETWIRSRRVPVAGDLDSAVAEWAEAVAATAPPLSPSDAARVAALLVRGGAAA
ncbi:helix-turn-helix domain-containing protein [Gordonia sp. MP11Mi]|uniref:Helix-turn-helix domain-containing protein n=1 Tax=Gordonia sp. MP11Mi TaxID=3022769 RepID=A0AA97GWV5_9ACTN